MKSSLILATSALCGSYTSAFVSSFSTNNGVAATHSREDTSTSTKLNMFFASEATEDTASKESMDVKLTPLDGSETSVINAAKFMVDAFWLQSPQAVPSFKRS